MAYITEQERRAGILDTTKSVVDAFAAGGDFQDMAEAKQRGRHEEAKKAV